MLPLLLSLVIKLLLFVCQVRVQATNDFHWLEFLLDVSVQSAFCHGILCQLLVELTHIQVHLEEDSVDGGDDFVELLESRVRDTGTALDGKVRQLGVVLEFFG